MRGIKVIGSVIAAALLVVSSASAANFDPANTIVHGHGSLTLRSPANGTGWYFACTVSTNFFSAGSDHGTTVNVAGADEGPTFGCTDQAGFFDPVTSGSAWTATATSATAVDLNINYTIAMFSGSCHLTIASVWAPNNTWSNAAHTLTVNSGLSFGAVRSGFCPGTDNTSSWSGSIVLSGDSTIT